MPLRMSEEEYLEFLARTGKADPRKAAAPAPEKKRTKYGNRKITVDGLKFDSQHEADYYFGTLLPMWKAGELKLLARQVPFDLPRGVRYVADFVTVDASGTIQVMDAKSEATAKDKTYRLKRRQMTAVWGIEIVEV